MPAVIWKVSSIICALLEVVRSGDARSRKYYTNCCDHYSLLSWTLQRKYVEECVIYQERKNSKVLAGYGRFLVKTKKKSKGLLNVEFTPRFLALRNTSMRLQKYTPSSQRFPSHFNLIYLRVVFTLISDKIKKPPIAFLRKEAFPSFAGYPLMDIWLAALSEPGEVRVHS